LRRAIVLFGAGASVEYKAPSTPALTAAIEQAVLADSWMQRTGGDAAFREIKRRLGGYLQGPVNFEHIYHVAHELRFAFGPTPGAADEFKPIMHPFLSDTTGLPKAALDALCGKIAEVIYGEVSRSCGGNPIGLGPLSNSVELLRSQYVTRLYTTNYDDFILQAVPDLYTGFGRVHGTGRRFDLERSWYRERRDAVAYLHGSVHMGFQAPPYGDIGELFWFDDRAEALKHSSFSGSSQSRMDGTSVLLTAVITGLEKLSRVQQRPFAHYYSMMARDAMRADIIFVIGSGLADLHLNTWLGEARSRARQPPVLVVDYWPKGFEHDMYSPYPEAKTVQLFHKLQVHISERQRGTRIGNWIVSQDRTAAVWDTGFQAFLNAPDDLQQIRDELIGARPSGLHLLSRRLYRAGHRLLGPPLTHRKKVAPARGP
jgi:hypothetical protein